MTESDASAPGPTGTATATDSGPDWADQVTNLVVESVDKVRDRTTGPILEYARISVHFVVAMILALPILVLSMLGVVRLLIWAVGHAWLAYAIVGAVFVIVGLALWSKRSKLPI